ncbi:MAG: LPS-assembly protein LptD [Burkholderiales bacterium]|nr:LPS-assembly protein LptD [Burkholderiales bacterium]
MSHRRSRRLLLLGPLAAIALAAAWPLQLSAQETSLRLSREIESPDRRAPASPGIGVDAPVLRPAPTQAKEERGAVYLRSDRLEGIADKHIEASGKVELRTRSETVLAEWLRYDITDDEIWAKGDVTLRRGLDWISGPEVKYKRDREIGWFDQPRFYMSENGGTGDAKEIRFAGPDLYEATNAEYTTCIAPNRDWYLRSDEIEVDRRRNVGTARGASVHFLGVPIMYTPWLEFPLSNERKSGFLTPTIGSTQTRGFEVSTPYYFNLAPNYDATLTPRIMTRRGLLLAGQGRYLFDVAAGETIAEVVPDDRVTGDTRWAFSWRHNQQLLPWLGGYVNYNRVSDATYLADFSDSVAVTSQKTLAQEAGFIANHGPFSMLVRVQSFQTLQDPNPEAAVVPPYNMLPQVRARLTDTDWLGLTWDGTAEYVQFSQSALDPTGTRASIYPAAHWMRQGSAWYVDVRAGLAAWHYDLDESIPGVANGRADVTVPVTSVDAGLVFERDWSIFGKSFVQTLEPRAMYTYIPYREQNQLPVFDTVQDDFNFTQLFSENRFIGGDRVGDTHQLAVAVTTRLLEPATGAEQLRLAVGQRFYFEDQKVYLPGTTPQKAGSSDFLVGAEGRLADAWTLIGLMQYDFGSSQLERFNVGTRYSPGPGRVLGLTYRYSRELVDQVGGQSELKQTYLSTQWPLSANWTFLGAWNYSIPDRKTLEAVVGLEYNGGCWALRLVGQQLTTTTETRTNSIFVQLELNGLARVGTSPLELLRRTVPGYLRTNDPSLQRRDHSSDPLPEF